MVLCAHDLITVTNVQQSEPLVYEHLVWLSACICVTLVAHLEQLILHISQQSQDIMYLAKQQLETVHQWCLLVIQFTLVHLSPSFATTARNTEKSPSPPKAGKITVVQNKETFSLQG